MAAPRLAETDLFAPVARFFESAGYVIHAEVHHCDLCARKDDTLVLVELKTSINFTLLVQAVERQRLSDQVYIAVPAKALGRPGRRRTAILRVLRRLELGVLAVDCAAATVNVVCHPVPFDLDRSRSRARNQLAAMHSELDGRSANRNVGGSTRQPIQTAYREASMKLVSVLADHGPLDCYGVKAHEGVSPKSTRILYQNHYGWFIRHPDGTYTASKGGLAALATSNIQETTNGE